VNSTSVVRLAAAFPRTFPSLHAGALLACALLAGSAGAQTSFLSWSGDTANDHLGYSVGGAGDVNDDGYPDAIVGAPDNDPSGISGAGSAYVHSGKDGALLWAVHGTQVGESFGTSVAGVADLNHDGFDDFAVGAPGFDNAVMVMNVGAVHVYSGKTGTKMFAFAGTQTGDLYGASVDGCGDWSGDGTPDIVVGVPAYDETIFGVPHADTGRAVIISGTVPSSIIHTFNGVDDGENFGWSVAGAGDWDADGFQDIVVGSPFSPTSVALGGKARVYSGKLKSLLFTAQGTVTGGSLGIGVGGAGDVNNDGKDDIVAGAYGESGNAGAVRVFLGSAGTPSWIKTGDAANDRLGYDVDGVGDANKDGFDDFAGGAYLGGASPGYFKVWSGKDGTLLYAKVNGPAGSEQFGQSLAGAGDLDQDGWVDLLVGDSDFDPSAGADAGRAWAYDIVVHQQNLGFGGPGAATLDMYGTPLSTGGKEDLHLQGAKPSANCWLVASAFQINAPFKGGVLVPDIGTGLALPFVTDGQGNVDLLSIAGGGGPFTVYLQFVIKDAAQPQGFALSNALEVDWLP
jgi:hypothetical protein